MSQRFLLGGLEPGPKPIDEHRQMLFVAFPTSSRSAVHGLLDLFAADGGRDGLGFMESETVCGELQTEEVENSSCFMFLVVHHRFIVQLQHGFVIEHLRPVVLKPPSGDPDSSHKFLILDVAVTSHGDQTHEARDTVVQGMPVERNGSQSWRNTSQKPQLSIDVERFVGDKPFAF